MGHSEGSDYRQAVDPGGIGNCPVQVPQTQSAACHPQCLNDLKAGNLQYREADRGMGSERSLGWKVAVALMGLLTIAYFVLWLPFCWMGIHLLSSPYPPEYVWDTLMVGAPAVAIGGLWWHLFRELPAQP